MRIVPVRFTDDVAGMRRFLEALGLTADTVSAAGTWVGLSGSGGGAGLHAAAAAEEPRSAGETSLSFEADEPLEAVRDRLAVAGFAAEIVDEAFGRSLRTIDPDGQRVQVNGTMTDPYGYTAG